MVNEESIVWKALSDPTRRKILDILRIKPQLIEELLHNFDISRIGLLKHIRILSNANLVFVRQKGRKKLYKLNVVPIQEIYERWITPYEKLFAKSLINLKSVVESGE